MNYDRGELGERLAANYVLGLMPRRARQRFERAMGRDATLAALAAGWGERLSPFDTATAEVPAPARVWRAIERRLETLAPVTVEARSRRPLFPFWRGFAALAVGACAAIVLYVAVGAGPMRTVVADLAEKAGIGELASSPPRPDIGLSLVNLGLSTRERPRWLRAALLLTRDSRIDAAAAPLPGPPPTSR
jgi:anti-sigma-K factor RskA